MAASLVYFRPILYSRCYPFSPFKLINDRRYLSDDSKKKNNLYETLGISSSATHGEIKKAYYDLTIKYHPDKNENCEDAALKFREVTEAYEILGNYGLRKKYDKGVPITSMKKVIEHAVNHKAQYQEFFDSRSSKRSSDFESSVKAMDELSSFSEKKERKLAAEKAKERNEDTPAVQIVVGIFFCILIYICR